VVLPRLAALRGSNRQTKVVKLCFQSSEARRRACKAVPNAAVLNKSSYLRSKRTACLEVRNAVARTGMAGLTRRITFVMMSPFSVPAASKHFWLERGKETHFCAPCEAP
jgi:hypothetical protein